MDSLPQELVEAIVDILPRSSLPSTSLIARRWRMRSQQRLFDSITFSACNRVDHWHSDIQRGNSRIPSYVHSARFRFISSWNDPTLFGRVLKGLCSLKALSVHRSPIPDQLIGHISRGEFGRGITALYLRHPNCGLSTITSIIFSLPSLKKLTVVFNGMGSSQPLSTPSVEPQKRLLDLLELGDDANGVVEALIQYRLASRCICLHNAISSVHRLLAISSETLVALMFGGV